MSQYDSMAEKCPLAGGKVALAKPLQIQESP